jgi:hypothetical protein
LSRNFSTNFFSRGAGWRGILAREGPPGPAQRASSVPDPEPLTLVSCPCAQFPPRGAAHRLPGVSWAASSSASLRAPWNAGARAFPGAFGPRRSLPYPNRWCWALWLRGGGRCWAPRGSPCTSKKTPCDSGFWEWVGEAARADPEAYAPPEPLAVPFGSSP